MNWGMIQEGGAFESLMHAILYAEGPGTILFGRPGKDAGQDARTADGTVVYQAKYRQGMTMDGAIDLAMKELEKIKLYRQSQHKNYEHWRNAQKWVLVANFSLNPNDAAKWKTGVDPAFLAEELTAEYWNIETLEGKLAVHTHIRDVFFDGENRVLVGLKEANDLLCASCIGGESLEMPMVGREGEMLIVNSFADSEEKRILPVIGPGGIGKSRLLYESLVYLSKNGWRVFWALPGTMAISSRWFNLLNGGQRTFVAIDNPDDPGLLRAVIEQLTTIERRNWKVIVACRSERSKVLHQFYNHKLVAEPLRLEGLDESASKQLLQAILKGREEAWLHSVHTYVRGAPGWLCLIAELAGRPSSIALPVSVDEIASAYVRSSLRAMDPTQRDSARQLLRWPSLWVFGRFTDIHLPNAPWSGVSMEHKIFY
jgi:hypothetical protein